jgi:hypothetical protein
MTGFEVATGPCYLNTAAACVARGGMFSFDLGTVAVALIDPVTGR